MLISALCDYYDILISRGDVLPDEYSSQQVQYAISLTPSGDVDGIIDVMVHTKVKDKKGKIKEEISPKTVAMPRRPEFPGICSYIPEHRPKYIFGLHYDKDNEKFVQDNKDIKSHKDFIEKNNAFFKDLNSPICTAYKNFIKKWDPENESENKYLMSIAKVFDKSKFEFCLSGHPEIMLHEDPEMLDKWIGEYSQKNTSNSEVAQCPVYGEMLPVAKTHNKIKGVYNSLASGAALICFNNNAESSYGKSQAANSNISEKAMEKYTKALNYLTSHNENKTVAGDVTILHWAMSKDKEYDDFFNAITEESMLDEKHTSEAVRSLIKESAKGIISIDYDEMLKKIDPDVTYYIVGIKPNKSRLAIKFVYKQTFGKTIENLLQHQKDLKLDDNSKNLSVYKISKELANPSADKKITVNPQLIEKIYMSAIYGYDYPGMLLSTMLRRIRCDQNTEKDPYKKINRTRIRVLKACVNRHYRLNGRKEVITLSLNKESTSTAYILGRLFAVLEHIQLKAAKYNLNRTIRDTYLSSAAERPAMVFPKLLMLSTYHLRKLKNPKFEEEAIAELSGKLNGNYPKIHTIYEQGEFLRSSPKCGVNCSSCIFTTLHRVTPVELKLSPSASVSLPP